MFQASSFLFARLMGFETTVLDGLLVVGPSTSEKSEGFGMMVLECFIEVMGVLYRVGGVTVSY